MTNYKWPGNVRELRNAIERAVLLTHNEVLTPDDFVLGPSKRRSDVAPGVPVLPPGGVDLAVVEEHLVRQALARAGDNQTQAAALLGPSRDQLRYRMQKYKLL